MILFGHNFLRSDFMRSTATRLTAAFRQQNTLADIWKYIQGCGCTIRKPTDAGGKNWIIDLTASDLPLPDGAALPWDQPLMVAESYAPAYGSPAVQIDMTAIYEPDPTALDFIEASPSHIDVKKAAYYRVDLSVKITVPVTGSAGFGPGAKVYLGVNGSEVVSAGGRQRFVVQLSQLNVARAADGGSGSIIWEGSVTGVILLAEGDILSVWGYSTGGGATIDAVEVGVQRARA